MTRKELIQNLLDGKKMTSDGFMFPDQYYIFFDENAKLNPFKISYSNGKEPADMDTSWSLTEWREVKEKPHVNPETGIEDKAFVEAWDNSSFCRVYGFYDAIYNCTFDYNGSRVSRSFDNYKVIEDIPDWAIEAKKLLKE